MGFSNTALLKLVIWTKTTQTKRERLEANWNLRDFDKQCIIHVWKLCFYHNVFSTEKSEDICPEYLVSIEYANFNELTCI